MLYSKNEMSSSNNLEFKRLALHAHILELQIREGENQRFIAPLPASFELAAERIADA